VDEAVGTVVLGKTKRNMGKRAGVAFAMHVFVHKSLAAMESRDIQLAAAEDFLGSEKTKGHVLILAIMGH
jgi:hypothetical protein